MKCKKVQVDLHGMKMKLQQSQLVDEVLLVTSRLYMLMEM